MSVDYIVNDYRIREYTDNPRGKCLVCAKRVVELLAQRNIPYRVIGLLSWYGLSDLTPANHYAVVASINCQAIIIDPTAGQFPAWQPFYGNIDDWITGLSLYLPHRLIKGREFVNVTEAETILGSLIMGSPLDFNGNVLQNTGWHSKIMKNPAHFSAQEQKQIQASTFFHLRRLKIKSRWNFLRSV